MQLVKETGDGMMAKLYHMIIGQVENLLLIQEKIMVECAQMAIGPIEKRLSGIGW